MRNKTTLSSNLGLAQTRISTILFNLYPFYSDTNGPPRLQKHCCTSSRSERANAIMSQFSRKGTGVKKSFAGVKKKNETSSKKNRFGSVEPFHYFSGSRNRHQLVWSETFVAITIMLDLMMPVSCFKWDRLMEATGLHWRTGSRLHFLSFELCWVFDFKLGLYSGFIILSFKHDELLSWAQAVIRLFLYFMK